eukprot:gene11885-11681_t
MNEGMLHTIMELVSDGIWDWNANTGFVYRNARWYEMLGYTPHSLDNNVLTWENIIHPDDFPQVMALFDDYLSQRTPVYQAEYRCRTHDGRYIWIEDRGHVLARNADGSVARMVGAHRSIEDKKRLLEALERRNQSLEALVEERTRELSRVNQQLQKQLEENRKLAETDALTTLAEAIRQGLSEMPSVGDFHVSMSFGVVQRFEEEQQTGLMARADQALYRSKIAGKNVITG